MYKDASQPIEERVNDLLGRMTLEEKVAQLGCVGARGLLGPEGLDPHQVRALLEHGIGQVSSMTLAVLGPQQLAGALNAIQRFLVEDTRLGIPAIMHSEALNGLVCLEAPNFPTAIGLAATWEPELVTRMTDLIRQQMRAVGVSQALSPVMDVARDARWGRVHETYGEDPCLCSAMSIAFVRGLQGENLADGVLATGKHFLGYGWSEAGQNMAATHVGAREVYEVYARPFEAAIREAGLGSVMNSYSEIDGIPVGSSREILTDLLRNRMGFRGVVVSDYYTVPWLMSRFGTAGSLKEAGVQALSAGLDMELPDVAGYGAELVQAVREGLIEEELVDRSVRRVLVAKFALGLFEQPYADPSRVQAVFAAPENRTLSRTLAERSLTLLKNDNGTLPLRKDLGTVAVIGPHADSVASLFPGYTFPGMLRLLRSRVLADVGVEEHEAAQAMPAQLREIIEAESIDAYIKAHYPVQSILDAIQGVVSTDTEVRHAAGCPAMDADDSGISEAVDAARGADVAILALGGVGGWLAGGSEGEGIDAANLDLPGVQQRLLEAVAETGTPVVLVLFGGRPYTIGWAAEHVPAILAVYYPGQEGAGAIAAALFGDVNPGGKLPVTIPRHVGQVPIYCAHKQGSGYGRTEADLHKGYYDMPSTPLYPFGHGLSYTTFAYDALQVDPARADPRGEVEISCRVTNNGPMAGDEVVQVYVRDRVAKVTRPVQELVGFQRVRLAPDETCTVTFRLPVEQLAFYDRDTRFVVEPGAMDVMVGGSSADIRLKGEFEITGEVTEVATRQAFIAKATVTY